MVLGTIIREVFRFLRLVAFHILRLRVVNFPLKHLLKLSLPFLPSMFPGKFPVVGDLSVELGYPKALRMTCDGRDSIASRIYWGGLSAHEPETMAAFQHVLRHSKVFLDIGASTGLFALIAAIESGSRVVHAFEPVPEIFKVLVKNIELNNLSNVTPVCSSVMDYDGQATLYMNRSLALPFSTSTDEYYNSTYTKIAASALKLDTYVAENNIVGVDLLKIDTEATEDKILEGAKQLLRRDQPMIFCEVLRRERSEPFLQHFFDGTDYEFFHITDRGLIHKKEILGDDEYVYRNYIFIPKGKARTILQGLTIIREDGCRLGLDNPQSLADHMISTRGS